MTGLHREEDPCQNSRFSDDATLRVSGGGYNGTGDIVFTIVGDRIARMIIG